jgi:3-methyladenine DNA glycosylase AlkD
MDPIHNPYPPRACSPPQDLAAFVSTRLAQLADPAKAAPMAAYMRTTQPFHGVQKAGVDAVCREALKRSPCASQSEYEQHVLALWHLPHREERYVAVRYARQQKFIAPASLPLYEQMIRQGAWWDFVDEIASHLVGGALAKSRAQVEPVLDLWIQDPDFWIRRAAVLSQLRLGPATSEPQLFRYCLQLAPEREFFLRKAIGWALREYSKTAPESVRAFLAANRDRLSPLTQREAVKHLRRTHQIP